MCMLKITYGEIIHNQSELFETSLLQICSIVIKLCIHGHHCCRYAVLLSNCVFIDNIIVVDM